MSAVLGTVATDFAATPRVLADPSEAHGVTQNVYDEYEAAGLASGSTITMGVPIPKGARLRSLELWHDDLGTTAGTLQAGIAGSTDLFLTAFATGSAGKQTLTGTYGTIGGAGYEFTADGQIVIETAGASITGTIKMWASYVRV